MRGRTDGKRTKKGLFSKSHGLTGHELYNMYRHMRHRCENPNHPDYPGYGGRGIRVCKRWLNFRNFVQDMHPRPLGMTLNRVDNDGPYSAENCRWATTAEQNRNYGRNIFVEYLGEKLIALDFAKIIGLKYGCVTKRLKLGWTVDQICNTPSGAKRQRA